MRHVCEQLCRYFEHFESEERVWPQAKAFEGGLQLTKASALEMAAENLTAEKRHQFDKGMAAAKEQAYVEFMENRAATIMQRWCRRVTLWTTAIRMVDDLRRRHRNYRIMQYWNEVDRHAVKMQAQWRGRQVRRWMPAYIQSMWLAAVDPETHKLYYQHYITGEAQVRIISMGHLTLFEHVPVQADNSWAVAFFFGTAS